MKVILLQDVRKLGKAGELVDISDGYAKNYILPQKLGQEAKAEVLNEWKLKKGSEANRKAVEREKALADAKELTGKSISITVKGGENGKLFGAVTAKDVAEALEKQYGLKVDKKKIILKDGIKNEGVYDVEVKLHPVASANIKVAVFAQQ